MKETLTCHEKRYVSPPIVSVIHRITRLQSLWDWHITDANSHEHDLTMVSDSLIGKFRIYSKYKKKNSKFVN